MSYCLSFLSDYACDWTLEPIVKRTHVHHVMNGAIRMFYGACFRVECTHVGKRLCVCVCHIAAPWKLWSLDSAAFLGLFSRGSIFHSVRRDKKSRVGRIRNLHPTHNQSCARAHQIDYYFFGTSNSIEYRLKKIHFKALSWQKFYKISHLSKFILVWIPTL